VPSPGLKSPRDGAAAERSAGLTLADLEALLFVAERPLARTEIVRLSGVDARTVDAMIAELAHLLRERGIRLVVHDDRVELATAPEAAPLVASYVGHEGPRLTPAALETLAIVAYRQPVTRGVIERIRGVDSDYVLRGLVHRRLVVELGRAALPGRPFLYGTGFEFLERFGLVGLDELPPLDAEAEAGLGPLAEPAPDGELAKDVERAPHDEPAPDAVASSESAAAAPADDGPR
jgi:segregation and condensation protein B